ETAEEIIERKRREIKDSGWTLWSFQHRTKETLTSWYKEIEKKSPKNVLAFCSEGRGTRAPAGETKYCNYYIPIDSVTPNEIPAAIKVLHP
ncbi:hypothetical protein ACXWO4_09970, partial [Streptococcus pyogenes]